MGTQRKGPSLSLSKIGGKIRNLLRPWTKEEEAVDPPKKKKRQRKRRAKKDAEEQQPEETVAAGVPAEDAPAEKTPAEKTPPGDQAREEPQPKKKRRRRRRKPEAKWTPPDIPEEEGEIRFLDLDLPEPLVRAVCELGFQYCTPIQREALPHSLAGKDVAGKAQTGTGKTAAFLLGAFSHMLKNPPAAKPRPGSVRTLVLAPTRELAIQIESDAEALGKYTDLNAMVVFGGMNYRKQQQQLQRPIDLMVATPGRLIDYMRRRLVDLSNTEILVIDEADRMLDMGFIPDVRRIVTRCPRPGKRQTLMWSATLTGNILGLIEKWMDCPEMIEIESESMVTHLVDQVFFIVGADEKIPTLFWLLANDEVKRMLIFTNRKDSAENLQYRLRRHGVTCSLLSGDVPQRKRIRVLDEFKSAKVPIIVATDVAARGIHVDDVSHVINYDLPFETEDYVHRVGRTGRAGETGKAISFADEYGSYIIPELEEYLGETIRTQKPTAEMAEFELPPKVELPPEQRRGRRGGGRRSGGRRGGGRRSGNRGGGGRRR